MDHDPLSIRSGVVRNRRGSGAHKKQVQQAKRSRGGQTRDRREGGALKAHAICSIRRRQGVPWPTGFIDGRT